VARKSPENPGESAKIVTTKFGSNCTDGKIISLISRVKLSEELRFEITTIVGL